MKKREGGDLTTGEVASFLQGLAANLPPCPPVQGPKADVSSAAKRNVSVAKRKIDKQSVPKKGGAHNVARQGKFDSQGGKKVGPIMKDQAVIPGVKWPFPTDYNDHFETSASCLYDLNDVLKALARQLQSSRAALRIYDPYYCDGTVVGHFNELGYKTILHFKRDFYSDIAQKRVPKYDMLVTNPPYSGDHKERILKFCAASPHPWALLMPTYVANKQYYKEAVGPNGGGVFFIKPESKYEFEHPHGTGRDSSPFESMWFVCVPDGSCRKACLLAVKQHLKQYVSAEKRKQPKGLSLLSLGKARSCTPLAASSQAVTAAPIAAPVTLATTREELVAAKVVTDVCRPSPAARRKASRIRFQTQK